MEVCSQFHVPAALPPGKDPPDTHLIADHVGSSVEKEISHYFPCQESNPGRPARSCTRTKKNASKV